MQANPIIVPPLLSIITVCLDEPNLERTCESIVNQTFQDFEWIVIDGGSNAATLEVFKKFKHRINYFVSEKDNGIYEAMNKGIMRSRGVWLNFMNAGDSFAANNILEKTHKAMENFLDIDVLYGEVVYGYAEGSPVSCTPQKNLLQHLYYSTIHHQPSFIKRACFEKYGCYDTSLRVVSDYKFFILLCKNGAKFLHLNCVLAIMDMNGISTTEKNKFEREIVIKELYSAEEIATFSEKITVNRAKNMAMRLRNNIIVKKETA